MSRSLVPCPYCARFVYADEEGCPFCASSLASGSPRAAIVAALALGATLSAGACRSERLHEQTVEVYGAPSYQPLPPTDASVARPSAVDVPVAVDVDESLRAAPAYGLAPPRRR